MIDSIHIFQSAVLVELGREIGIDLAVVASKIRAASQPPSRGSNSVQWWDIQPSDFHRFFPYFPGTRYVETLLRSLRANGWIHRRESQQGFCFEYAASQKLTQCRPAKAYFSIDDASKYGVEVALLIHFLSTEHTSENGSPAAWIDLDVPRAVKVLPFSAGQLSELLLQMMKRSLLDARYGSTGGVTTFQVRLFPRRPIPPPVLQKRFNRLDLVRYWSSPLKGMIYAN